jgi:hypothetical protein
MYFDISSILFSFPSYPELHRLVSLLQTCSVYKCVCDHICFYVYVCLLDLFSTYERKHVAFLFEPDLLHLTWCPPIAFIYLQTTWCHSSLWLNKIPFCVCVCACHIFLIHSSEVGHLNCFHSLAIVNSAAINISVQVSLLYPELPFLWIYAQE